MDFVATAFCSHAAFELQAEKNKEAVRTGEWKASEAGSVFSFDPNRRWHAGQEALKESSLPEFLVLFQFALAPIAEFYDAHLDVGGGFGQHAWCAETARSQLEEVQTSTFDMTEAYPGN